MKTIMLVIKCTCIVEGVRISKVAEALKEKVAKGLDKLVEFSMVRLLVLIAWQILFTFSKGVVLAARSGSSSENVVYLTNGKSTKDQF